MSASPEPSLLYEIDALRAHLAECLHQVEHLEQRLRGTPPPAERPLAGPHTDPFERALPTPEPEASGRFTIRDLPLPASSHANPGPAAPHVTAWEPGPSVGDGTPDPFAFLDVPTHAAPRNEASEVYRGVHALLGGLDVTTRDESA